MGKFFGWQGARGNRGFGRRRKPRVQWVISTQGYGSNLTPWTAGVGQGLQTASLIDASTTATTLGDPALDRFTIMRIVGDIGMFASVAPSADSNWYLHMGVYLTDVASAGAALFNPSLQVDGDYSWLWLRHYTIGLFSGAVIWSTGNGPQNILADGMHLDIRVKRVVRPNQRLNFALIMGLLVGGAAATVIATPYLRTLVAKAI